MKHKHLLRCKKSATLILVAVLFSVISFATVAPITGTTQICFGSHRRLSDVTPSGVWSSSNTGIATADTAGRIYGASLGTATITYTVGTGYAITTVSVIPSPSVDTLTGGGSRCSNGRGIFFTLSGTDAGDDYGLYVSDSSGTTHTGTFLGTGAAMILGPAYTEGSYIVIASTPAGCTAIMAGTAIIVVNPLPSVVTGPDSVCEGAVVTFSDSTAGGAWSSLSSAFAVVDTSGMVTGVSGGRTYISYTLPTGCAERKVVSVLPMPLPIITYDWTTNSFNAPAGYDSYQWYGSSIGSITGATSPSLAPLATDSYYVEVTNNYGCIRSSSPLYFDISQEGLVNMEKDSKENIHPVPARNELYIAAGKTITHVAISNLLGQVVYSRECNAENIRLNIESLQPGMYFIKINDGAARKFVKE